MSDQHRLSDEGRAERAFRSAINELDVVDLVNPRAARRQVRRQRLTGLIATAVLVLVAAVAVPQLLWPDRVASWVSRPQPITEWRTEHYRDITFEVPAKWAYDDEPSNDCYETSHPKGYVALERHRPVLLNSCSLDDGHSLRSEHVHVQWLDKTLPPTEGTTKVAGWWTTTRVFGDVWLRVVSRDRALVDRVLSSVTPVTASTSGPCTPHNILERNPLARPQKAFDVTRLERVDSITLCQYESQSDSRISGLSRQAVLTSSAAQSLLQGMQQSEPARHDGCRAPDMSDALTVVAHLHTGTTTRTVNLVQWGCISGRIGRVDDGTTVRGLSPAACEALLIPPIGTNTGDDPLAEECRF